MEIRLVTGADAEDFQAIRLRALRESPDAFGSTLAEEQERTTGELAARLSDPEAGFVLGAAEAGGPLVGIAGCRRESGRKRRHTAIVWGMFVAPEARGRGVGGELLDAVIARSRDWDGIEQLTLTVVPDVPAARALYLSRGFVPFGLEPRAMRDGARHFDLEYLRLPLGER
jgi:GNAT superfamily N-acetyltransferase